MQVGMSGQSLKKHFHRLEGHPAGTQSSYGLNPVVISVDGYSERLHVSTPDNIIGDCNVTEIPNADSSVLTLPHAIAALPDVRSNFPKGYLDLRTKIFCTGKYARFTLGNNRRKSSTKITVNSACGIIDNEMEEDEAMNIDNEFIKQNSHVWISDADSIGHMTALATKPSASQARAPTARPTAEPTLYLPSMPTSLPSACPTACPMEEPAHAPTTVLLHAPSAALTAVLTASQRRQTPRRIPWRRRRAVRAQCLLG
jgi:hypothetical protein